MDYLIIGILVVIFGSAITYIVKAKKSGIKCIGCASSKTCSSYKNGTSCNCNINSITNTNKNQYDELHEFAKNNIKN